MIWLLELIFILFLVVAFYVQKKDFISPSVVFCACYVISIACAIYNIENWSIELGWKTFWVLIVGAVEFIFIDFIISRFFNKKKKDREKHQAKKQIIEIKTWKIVLIITYELLALTLLVFTVLKIADEFGTYNSYGEAIKIFKDHTSYSADRFLPTYVSILIKPIEVLAYIFIYVIIHNFFNSEDNIRKKIKQNLVLLAPILLFMLRYLLVSNRGSILQWLVASVIMLIIAWYEAQDWKKTIPKKYIFRTVIIVIIIAPIFYLSGFMLKRNITVGAVDYITMYAGGSIANLDSYLKRDDNPHSEIVGIETFSSLSRRLYQIGLIKTDKTPTVHLGWRYVNGRNLGNVYTSYRRWINDFGYIGMFILNAIEAAFFSVIYNLLKHKRIKNKIPIIIYSYLFYTLVLHSVDSVFYNTVFSIGFMMFLAFLFAGYCFIIKQTTIKPNVTEK